jgi:hypothetical protein
MSCRGGLNFKVMGTRGQAKPVCNARSFVVTETAWKHKGSCCDIPQRDPLRYCSAGAHRLLRDGGDDAVDDRAVIRGDEPGNIARALRRLQLAEQSVELSLV